MSRAQGERRNTRLTGDGEDRMTYDQLQRGSTRSQRSRLAAIRVSDLLRHCTFRQLLAIILWCPWLSGSVTAVERTIDFDRDIRPIFAQNCLVCHGPSESEAGLRLDSQEGATTRLESGMRAVVPRRAAESELLTRVTSQDPDSRMPPEGDGLSSAEVSKLRRWIDEGANWQSHWAYRPLTTAPIPTPSNQSWSFEPLDEFVLDRLENANIEPSAQATRFQLLRRLYLDLIGLPPSWPDVRRYVHDRRPDADERVIDRLLASPQFGERWGRHWLDKARFADSDGYEKDNVRPHAWRYRDWVITAINEDMPFDRFTICQLAGDLLPDASPDQLLATAFHRQTLTNTEGGTDQEQWRVAAVMDRAETLGTVWLGLTVGCARCHSHKYDAIAHREYYQLYGYFNNADETTAELPTSKAAQLDFKETESRYVAKIRSLESKLARARDSTESADFESLKKQLDEAKQKAPKSPKLTVRVITERMKDRRMTHVLRRGDFREPLDSVEPGTLSTLPPLQIPDDGRRSSDRLDLARWLVSGKNPLPPRVLVNHLWRNMFGEGLVRTMNDFGVRGERPTHPGLLDYLAGEFVRLQWSRKTLIRRIALSATYQQRSTHRPELAEVDPTNRLLYRQNRFRVEAELIRDSALAVSGLLVERIGGPSVFPPIPDSITALTYNSSFQWKTSTNGDQYRRELYTFFKRTAPHPNLITFDCPDSNVTSVERDRSNTPIGALVVMNNPIYFEASRALAGRLLMQEAVDDATRIRHAVRMVLGRESRGGEVSVMQGLLDDNRRWYADHPAEAELAIAKVAKRNSATPLVDEAAWVALARCLLNLDEFVTRE